MNLAILFWFHTALPVCINRLELLKRWNPYLKIFGLFGGEQNEGEWFRKALGGGLDDFFASQNLSSPEWKWAQGDLLWLEWYEERGRGLEWDSVIVVHWDMLIIDSLISVFPSLKEDHVFIAGIQPMSPEIENRWAWTSPTSPRRPLYDHFLQELERCYRDRGGVFCGLLVPVILPRVFFEKWRTLEHPEIGAPEYRIPTYAKKFALPLYEKNVGGDGPWWIEKTDGPINARKGELSQEYILEELKKPDGWSIFHPYYALWEGDCVPTPAISRVDSLSV